MITNKQIKDKAENIFNYLSETRKTLHKQPELSFQELRTSAFICDELSRMNIPFKKVINTGVVALIGQGDNCVALRADIDALPISEETGCGFASEYSGVMHACGHDMHTTMLLGAAKILKELESQLNGTVMLIFQPGEEKLPGGAKLMIQNGLFKDLKPSAIFGQHVNPAEIAGKVSLNSGYIMASADELYWTISGKGAHAAQPHLARDPINAAANIIIQLQSIINKFRNPLEPAVLTVTSIHGGTATNIIPEEVKMMGTLRTFNNDWRFQILSKIKLISELTAAAYNCSCTFESPEGYPPLQNDVKLTDFVRQTASDLLGQPNVYDFEPKMWAEDFSYYYSNAGIPSLFWFLGAKSDSKDENYGLHHPKFLPDENAMINGCALFVASAINWLNR
jgi:amidohydrolase